MDKRSKILIWASVLILVGAIYWGYQTFMVDRDFVVHNYAECDPTALSCFVWCEDGECEEEYYSKIVKKASNVDLCNGAIEECEPLRCETSEAGCEIIYCSADTVDEGEICTYPGDFQPEEPELVATTTDSEI